MVKWGHEAIRGYKYKITNERISEQDSTHCSKLCYLCTPFVIQKLYLVISANSSSDPIFSSSTSNTEFAARLLQQALLGQRGGYVAMASATP